MNAAEVLISQTIFGNSTYPSKVTFHSGYQPEVRTRRVRLDSCLFTDLRVVDFSFVDDVHVLNSTFSIGQA